MKRDIQAEVQDSIMERPYGFEIAGEAFALYPATLGKTLLLSRLVKELGIEKDILRVNPFLEALRLVHERRESIARILAYHTAKTKDDVFNEFEMQRRIRLFSKKMEPEDMATLFLTTFTRDNVDDYRKFFRLDKEQVRMGKAAKARDTRGNYSFGGLSIYGSLIDRACERYGWSFDYVVWGISFANLQMLMNDQHISIYLNKDERRKAHITQRGNATTIDANNPKNNELIRKIFGGK